MRLSLLNASTEYLKTSFTVYAEYCAGDICSTDTDSCEMPSSWIKFGVSMHSCPTTVPSIHADSITV